MAVYWQASLCRGVSDCQSVLRSRSEVVYCESGRKPGTRVYQSKVGFCGEKMLVSQLRLA